MIQPTGTIAPNQRFHYDAFGKRLDANIADTKLLYSGEWTDAATGLQFLRARYYNPGVGRFTTLDPFAGSLEDPLSLHKYAYANGDPIQHTDPTGMFSVTEINVSGAINNVLSRMSNAAVYVGKQGAYAGVETALEMAIGSMISGVIGVPFNPTQAEIERSFFTNWTSNVAVGHMCQANRLRQVLDFTIRTVSDVWVGEQNLYWTVGINLASLAGSEILSNYAGQILGKAFEKYGCFVAGTSVVTGFDDDPSVDWISDGDGEITTARRTTTLAIESIPLGSRVITESPEEHFDDDGFGEPNQSTWRKVTMLHHRRDGTVIEVELLRPASWLELLGIAAGRIIDLTFGELQTAGYARVLGVSDCPPIQDGEGRVVIGRFVSRGVGSLLRVTLTDGSVFTGTANHPVWSVDANDWRRLDEFQVGDQMLALDGLIAIASIASVPKPADVFNIEVECEHVYRIAESGILVHNADYAPVSVLQLPWGRVGARHAARAIEAGQTSITVASRDDAVEVLWRMFVSRGFLNTTGRKGIDVRTISGSKAGTYLWDEVLDAAGNVAGHGADNIHAAMKHVQIHLEDGNIVRIFFP